MPDNPAASAQITKSATFAEQWEKIAEQCLALIKPHINNLGLKPLSEIIRDTADKDGPLRHLLTHSTAQFHGHEAEYHGGSVNDDERVTPIFIASPSYRLKYSPNWLSNKANPVYMTLLISRKGRIIIHEVEHDKHGATELTSRFLDLSSSGMGVVLATQATDASGAPTSQTWGNLLIVGLSQHLEQVAKTRSANLEKDQQLIGLISQLQTPQLEAAHI